MDLPFTSALGLPSCKSFLFKEVFKIGTLLPFNQGKETSKEKDRMDFEDSNMLCPFFADSKFNTNEDTIVANMNHVVQQQIVF